MARDLLIGTVRLGSGPCVVAAGGEAEVEALVAADGAHVVELRADLFDRPEPAALERALVRLRAGGRPIILTVRAGSEGGRPLPDAQRAALYTAGLPHVDAIDVEIASRSLVADLVPRAHAAGKRVILSAHAFDATPPADQLLALVDQARQLGADLPKLAAQANSLADLRTLLGVTLATQDRGVVVLAMGSTAALSRVFFPAAGSLLTYGAAGKPTAPGQLPVSELVALLARFYPR